MTTLIAQSKSYDKFEGLGPLGRLVSTTGEGVFIQFNQVISLILGILTISGGLWFIFQLFGGILQWIGSGGEKQSLQNAQKRIVNALIGLLLIVIAYGLIAIISRIFGLYILSPWDALQGNTPPSHTPGNLNPNDPCFGVPENTPC